ncbi:MAG: TetR family transcriptional regulator [Oceanospirillaceae bacterium]|nr:TetR family transcriptional regulator [Oceanospirillaceae bacterium]MBT10624.1 TetR family transcriptional regulator [Oceanospirillaceae bacterium]
MAGLREQQKEQRRQAIASAAVELFDQKGFQQTRMEDIASRSGVSVPTVFKYFPSKQAILFEFLKHADRRALDRATAEADFSADPVDTLCLLEEAITHSELEVMPVALWREILPLILFSPRNELPATYLKMNEILVKDIEAFLAELQRHGHIREDADLHMAAYMLNDYSHLQLTRLIREEPLDWEAHRANVRATTALVFYGIAR